MTNAPPVLLDLRHLLQPYLKLPDVSLGIVGDPKHRGGYHCGRDKLDADDYSVRESPRDAKPSLSACALDIGQFSIVVKGKTHTLRTLSTWLVAQCAAGTADTADIREVIYSPDGKTVRRWDRLKRRTTGDSSHTLHTHISWHRDSISRDKTAVFRRWLTTIGATAGPVESVKPAAPSGGTDVSWNDDVITNPAWRSDAETNPFVTGKFALYDAWNQAHAANAKADALAKKLDLVLAGLTSLAGKDMTDEAAIVQQVLAGLSPAAIAGAMPPAFAQQVVDILTERLAK